MRLFFLFLFKFKLNLVFSFPISNRRGSVVNRRNGNDIGAIGREISVGAGLGRPVFPHFGMSLLDDKLERHSTSLSLTRIAGQSHFHLIINSAGRVVRPVDAATGDDVAANTAETLYRPSLCRRLIAVATDLTGPKAPAAINADKSIDAGQRDGIR